MRAAQRRKELRRHRIAGTAPTLELTVLGPAVRLAIPAAQTEALTRNGVWDLEMYQGTTVVRILQGRAVISPEVTR